MKLFKSYQPPKLKTVAGKILPLTREHIFDTIVAVEAEHMFEANDLNTQLLILAVQRILKKY